MKTIRSYNHQIGSFELNKVSLSCFDDKRYIHEDSHDRTGNACTVSTSRCPIQSLRKLF